MAHWTVACRDEAGNERPFNVERLSNGAVRLTPPLVGTTLWTPEELDALLVVLHEVRAQLRNGD
jgi:hypothetical protein